jgi:hypothetical protein
MRSPVHAPFFMHARALARKFADEKNPVAGNADDGIMIGP